MNLNRDSWLWSLSIAGALLAYLSSAPAPTDWDYPQVIQFLSAVVATISGKLATSPLKGDRG